MMQSRGITAYSGSRCCEKLILPFTLLSFKSQPPLNLLLSSRSFVICTQTVSSEYMKLIYAPVSILAGEHEQQHMSGSFSVILKQTLLLPIKRGFLKSQLTKSPNVVADHVVQEKRSGAQFKRSQEIPQSFPLMFPHISGQKYLVQNGLLKQ